MVRLCNKCDLVRHFAKILRSEKQGNRNCGILASRMGGSGDRERKWDKFHSPGLKMVFSNWIRLKLAQMRPKMDQTGLRIVFLHRTCLFWQNYFAEHTLLEEIISEWSQHGREPHNFCYPAENKQVWKTDKLIIKRVVPFEGGRPSGWPDLFNIYWPSTRMATKILSSDGRLSGSSGQQGCAIYRSVPRVGGFPSSERHRSALLIS